MWPGEKLHHEVWHPTFNYWYEVSYITGSRNIDLGELKQTLGRVGSELPDIVNIDVDRVARGAIILAFSYNPQQETRDQFKARAAKALQQEMTAVEESE